MPLFSRQWRNKESGEPQNISLTSLKVKTDKMDANDAQNNNNGEGYNEDQLYRSFPDYSKSMSVESGNDGMRYRNVNGGATRQSPFQRHFEEEDVHKLNEETSWCKDRNIYVNQYRDTSKRFQGFLNLMKLWKGSVMKLIWHDLLVFLLIYVLMTILYRTVLFNNPVGREVFELLCIYASRFRHLIPITFLTGFYVSQVVTRYWDQFMTLPFPDKLALKMVSFIPGQDPFRRNLRRTVMRYVNLSIVLVYRMVSLKVHNRFPNLQSLIDAKLLMQHEAERLQKIEQKTPHEATWVPMLWALKLIQRARTEGKITIEAPVYGTLVSGFDYIESCNRKILNYGWVNFPLAYTQVATISVFMYFFTSLFAAQYLIPQDAYQDNSTFPHLPKISFSLDDQYKPHTPDIYFPFFTIVEFISYMGWIKVAETLLNPFGDDDEDFEINYLIDRNLQVSYMIVDNAEMQMEMAQDPFLEAGITIPTELPYKEGVQKDVSSRKVTSAGMDEADASKFGSLRRGIRKMSRTWSRPHGNVSNVFGPQTSVISDHHSVTEPSPKSSPHVTPKNFRRRNSSLVDIQEQDDDEADTTDDNDGEPKSATFLTVEAAEKPNKKKRSKSPSNSENQQSGDVLLNIDETKKKEDDNESADTVIVNEDRSDSLSTGFSNQGFINDDANESHT